MELYYMSSEGEVINLNTWPIMIQEPEGLFENEWSYDAEEGTKNGGKITKFYKKIVKKSLQLSIFASSKSEYNSLMQNMMIYAEKDIENLTPGKIYLNGYYLTCYLVLSKYGDFEELFNSVEKTIDIVTEYPFWIKEETISFLKNNTTVSNVYLEYPYEYPYDYAHDKTVAYLENKHYKASNFKLVIYGACEDPSIIVNGHTYSMAETLYEGEYIVVNSRDNTIVKHNYNGENVNCFNCRNKVSDIFKKIASGKNVISWNTLFGFDVTLYEERSEPEWIL